MPSAVWFLFCTAAVLYCMAESPSSRSLAASRMGRRSEDNQPAPRRSRKRVKRSWSDWILEGTKWCGYDNIADNETDYGVHREMDKCCQEHDKCPMTIGPYETKYELLNVMPYTLAWCKCDEKFYQCLMNLSRTDENAKSLGEYYFGMIQPFCFYLDYGEVCISYHLWSGCRERANRFQAKRRFNPIFRA